MNIQLLIDQIESEFEEVVPGTIKPDSSFRELPGWSSMHALILIALIDNEYDILLTGAELKNLQTVQDLFDIIQAK
jgi:acyl carrier protein